jgi:hypothetical protein
LFVFIGAEVDTDVTKCHNSFVYRSLLFKLPPQLQERQFQKQAAAGTAEAAGAAEAAGEAEAAGAAIPIVTGSACVLLVAKLLM